MPPKIWHTLESACLIGDGSFPNNFGDYKAKTTPKCSCVYAAVYGHVTQVGRYCQRPLATNLLLGLNVDNSKIGPKIPCVLGYVLSGFIWEISLNFSNEVNFASKLWGPFC